MAPNPESPVKSNEGLPASTPGLDPSSQEQEKERLRRFPIIPSTPEAEDGIESGVLLSDQIKRLIDRYKMIDPFREGNLKAASYELSVGGKYGRAGKTYTLEANGKLTIEPFDVVIIQTRETLNLPPFLIARWNIRIKWAYLGLLWVGAPQVDPGFKGLLACPLYNLSSQPVTLSYGDPVAAMDFVTTTKVTADSKPYPWDTRTRIVFEDYEKDGLESALMTKTARQLIEMEKLTKEHSSRLDDLRESITETQHAVETNLDGVQQHFNNTSGELKKQAEDHARSIQTRLDSYTATTFTVIAFLFAALGLALTKSPDFSLWSTSAPLAAIALWFALRAFYLTRAGGAGGQIPRFWFEIVSGLALALAFLAFQFLSINRHYAEWTAVRDSAVEAKRAVEDLRTQTAASKEMRQHIDSVQLQIDVIRDQLAKYQPSPPKPTNAPK
jgi:deoxycytidine triphosphate deaminase